MNSVCFCLPLPFFPFPPAGIGASASATSPSCADDSPVDPDPHAATAGAPVDPSIFLSDTFPLTCGFVRTFDDDGRSGNRAFDNFGGACLLFVFRAAEDDVGVACVRNAGGVALLPDQGVLRWPALRYFCAGCATACCCCCCGAGEERPSAGKRSCTRLGPGWDIVAGPADAALAAIATLFHTCWDCDERVAVECFALRTRPEAIPAYPEPIAVGVKSGN